MIVGSSLKFRRICAPNTDKFSFWVLITGCVCEWTLYNHTSDTKRVNVPKDYEFLQWHAIFPLLRIIIGFRFYFQVPELRFWMSNLLWLALFNSLVFLRWTLKLLWSNFWCSDLSNTDTPPFTLSLSPFVFTHWLLREYCCCGCYVCISIWQLSAFSLYTTVQSTLSVNESRQISCPNSILFLSHSPTFANSRNY